jgi:DNA-binding MarR family transcriptional regulator
VRWGRAAPSVRAISRLYEAAFAPLDLTGTQFCNLVAVQLLGPVPLSRLAERLVLDRTSLYRAVKPLVRRRCLRILAGQTRRERTATLTEAGSRLLADALPIWEQVQGRFVGALGPPGLGGAHVGTSAGRAHPAGPRGRHPLGGLPSRAPPSRTHVTPPMNPVEAAERPI